MNLIFSFLSGFFSATLGISPPGLINMTAAKISMKDGKESALLFVLGALVLIFFQTLIAVLFSKFIDSHPNIEILLKEIGVVIFVSLSIYFLLIAKKPINQKEAIKIHSKSSRFFLGMLYSAINLFPIPYYVFITISLSSYSFFSFTGGSISLFLIGVILGSFMVFNYYIIYFKKIETKTDFFFQNMNIIIGAITGLVALFTLFKIFKYYY